MAAPRVYAADVDGVHEWIVAAPNQRAALDAFGVHQDLFAQGLARPEQDPAHIAAAREHPGIPLRRLKGAKGEFRPVGEGGSSWSAALAAAPRSTRPAARPAKASPKKATAKVEPRRPSAAERRALREAEAALRTFERDAVKAQAALDAERQAFEQRARKLERERDRSRAALEQAVDKARLAIEDPS